MPEKCALSHGSGVLGRDPRDSCRFWSPHVGKSVHSHTDSAWGGWWGGGGIPLGGSANREPGSYNIYIYMLLFLLLLLLSLLFVLLLLLLLGLLV